MNPQFFPKRQYQYAVNQHELPRKIYKKPIEKHNFQHTNQAVP